MMRGLPLRRQSMTHSLQEEGEHGQPSIGGGPRMGQVAEGARGRMGKNLHSGLRGKEWARQGKLV